MLGLRGPGFGVAQPGLEFPGPRLEFLHLGLEAGCPRLGGGPCRVERGPLRGGGGNRLPIVVAGPGELLDPPRGIAEPGFELGRLCLGRRARRLEVGDPGRAAGEGRVAFGGGGREALLRCGELGLQGRTGLRLGRQTPADFLQAVLAVVHLAAGEVELALQRSCLFLALPDHGVAGFPRLGEFGPEPRGGVVRLGERLVEQLHPPAERAALAPLLKAMRRHGGTVARGDVEAGRFAAGERRQFLGECDRLRAGGGHERDPRRLRALREQFRAEPVGRVAERHPEHAPHGLEDRRRIIDDLGQVADERAVGMLDGEVADQAVVVHPDLDRERRVRTKRLVPAAEQRVDHLPRSPHDEQEAGLRHEAAPELEVQRGPRILPAPDSARPPPRGHEGLGLLFERGGHLRRGLDDEALRGEAVGTEHELVPFDEVEVLEVPRLVAPVRPEQAVADPHPGRLAEARHERGAGTVHARDHERRCKLRCGWSTHGVQAGPTARRPGGRGPVLKSSVAREIGRRRGLQPRSPSVAAAASRGESRGGAVSGQRMARVGSSHRRPRSQEGA